MKQTNRMTGQAMVEYLVVSGLAAAALFVPTALTNNLTVPAFLLQSLKQFYQAFTFLISLS